MPQIEKPDDLQLIANLIRFFCICITIAYYGGIIAPKLNELDLSVGTFGKRSVVYRHIDENGDFVSTWFARKMAITDKCKGRL